MAVVDFIVIAVCLILFWKGFRTGLIGMLGWLAGLLAGIWLAGQYYQAVADFLSTWIDGQILASVVGFITILVGVVIVVGIVFRIINKIFNFIPVLGFFNRLVGGVLGLAEAIIILGILFWLIVLVPFNNTVTESVENSQLRPAIVNSTTFIRGLLPESLKAFAEFNANLPKFDINELNIDKDNITPEQLEEIINNLTPEQAEQLKQE